MKSLAVKFSIEFETHLPDFGRFTPRSSCSLFAAYEVWYASKKLRISNNVALELSRKYPRFWGSPKMTHFQIRKTSFGSFSAVSTNFKILQILRNAGRPPASNSIESRSVWPRKRRKPQLSKISKSPAANPSPYPLPLTLTP